MDKAIGIVRVSQQGDRDDDRFMSPDVQRERIKAACKDKWRLLDIYEELDVSGGTPLAKRTKGLLPAVEAIEAGRATVLVVAYFDRLVRSIKVQSEVVERIEAAGGDVFTLDAGQITNGSAVERMTSNFLGAVAQYVREAAAERTADGQQRALEKGHWPIRLIPGYRRKLLGHDENDDPIYGSPELDPDTCHVVAEAFRMRAGKPPRVPPATIWQVRDHLARHNVERSYHGVQSLLRNRQAIGELSFGEQTGTMPALIDKDTFDRVQRIVEPRGRRPKSSRLLARVGVLRCAACGSRMVTGTQTQHGRQYPFYRCPGKRGKIVDDCTQRATISGQIVEQLVVDTVKKLIDGYEGSASAEAALADAAAELERAQSAYDGVVEMLTGQEDEAAAQAKIRELREARNAARDRHDELRADLDAAEVAVSAGDWDQLTLDEQRALIKATIDRVTILPTGRGAERIFIEPKVIT